MAPDEPAPLTGKERSQQLALERRTARLAAVQALYQWDQTGGTADAIVAEFSTHRITRATAADTLGSDASMAPADRKLFAEIVRGVAGDVSEIDDMLAAVLSDDWQVDRLESILRAVMRAGAYELAHRLDVPPKVVISEYIAVADAFFGDKETAMAHGVLDRLAHELRPAEMAAGGGRGNPTAR